MKLEYLADGSSDCPLLRLYEFSSFEARQLHDIVDELVKGAIQSIDVHKLPFIAPICGCELVLALQSWDQAIVQTGPTSFTCGLTAGTWEDVAGLIEPFEQNRGGFQWLITTPGEVALLLSVSGTW